MLFFFVKFVSPSICTILVVALLAIKTRKIILKNLISLYDKIFEIPTFFFILAKNEARTVKKWGV